MSPEERQVLVELFQRTNAASAQPRDRDAEAFIAEAVRIQPYAPYLLAQAVLLQEQAMKSASERLQQLEAENQELRERVAQGGQPAQQGQGGFLGGLGSLFGGAQGQPAPQRGPEPPPRPGGPWGGAAQGEPPQQQSWGAPQQSWGGPPPPPQQAGPWGGAPQQQGGGSTFLKGALGAAAGVAGGALLVNSLSGMFGGHGQGAGLGSGFGGLGQQAGMGGGRGETVVNNYYGDERGDDRGRDDAGYQNASDDSDYDDDGSSDDDTYDA